MLHILQGYFMFKTYQKGWMNTGKIRVKNTNEDEK